MLTIPEVIGGYENVRLGRVGVEIVIEKQRVVEFHNAAVRSGLCMQRVGRGRFKWQFDVQPPKEPTRRIRTLIKPDIAIEQTRPTAGCAGTRIVPDHEVTQDVIAPRDVLDEVLVEVAEEKLLDVIGHAA